MLELEEYRIRVGKFAGWGIGKECDHRFPGSIGFSLPGTKCKFSNYKSILIYFHILV